MRKTIEVTPLSMLGPVPAAGFYDYVGSLYVASAPNMHPMYVGLVAALCSDAESEQRGGGVSEATLLKALAIAQNPALAEALTR